jgi:hypothetical protein
MPNITYPDVPQYPGVPALVRSNFIPPEVTVNLGLVQSLLASALQSATQWGIFDSLGNQLGINSQGSGLFKSIIAVISGKAGPYLSTNAFEFTKETRISDFLIQKGSFANYNKVELPANPMVTLALAGTEAERTTFLNQIAVACVSTALYSVVTPEVTYYNYSLERYNYVRRAERGATLILVEISLKEIRQVSAAYSTVQTPINQPQNPAATPQTNGGSVQPAAPQQSTLKALYNLFPSLKGAN